MNHFESTYLRRVPRSHIAALNILKIASEEGRGRVNCANTIEELARPPELTWNQTTMLNSSAATTYGIGCPASLPPSYHRATTRPIQGSGHHTRYCMTLTTHLPLS